MTRTPFHKIPSELRDRPQWAVWKRETRDGKPTKVPYSAKSGHRADITDPTTWASFDEAVAAQERGGFNGIGFVFSKDDPYCGVDLDHVRDPQTRDVEPWARDVVQRLSSYTEHSQSGTGAHVIAKGKVPGTRRRKSVGDNGAGIEMYCEKRFFVMTGQRVKGTPATVEERQTELDHIHQEIFGMEPALLPSSTSNSKPATTDLPPLLDHDLISRACAANGNFSQLWNGDRSGYSSHSEADLALCSHLAFWTGKDPARMDQLFRQSGLMRDKWDRQDYKQRTLAKAIESTSEVYSPQCQVQQTAATSRATDLPIHYDSGKRNYWITNTRGGWIEVTETSVRRHLKAAGFSPRVPEDDTISPLDTKLIEIQRELDVAFAGPLAGFIKGITECCGHRILVTESPRLIEPTPGNWPMIEALLAGLLDDPVRDQRPFVLGWLKVALEALRERAVRPGQVQAIAGPRDSGKSLWQNLTTEILGGRAAKPFRYMSGATPFNGELFGAEHLLVEDEVSSSDIRSRRHLGARIKDFTVNEVQSHHAKHRQAISLKPFWRVTITLNDEPENILILPPLDESLADKIMLLKAHKRPMPMPTQSLAQRKAFWAALVSELPAFTHYLLEWEIPAELRSERFGVTHYHHPDLLAALDDLSPELRLLAIIDTELFAQPSAPPWEGTADQLESRLRQGPRSGEVGRLLTFNTACGVYLGRLHLKLPERIKKHREPTKRIWTILP